MRQVQEKKKNQMKGKINIFLQFSNIWKQIWHAFELKYVSLVLFSFACFIYFFTILF